AADISYIGHSASLARCHFRTALPARELPEPRPATRRIYPGRLDELTRAYRDNRRPSPGTPVAATPAVTAAFDESIFSRKWMVLEHIGGEMPDVRGAAIVAKAIRDTLLSGYGKAGIARAD